MTLLHDECEDAYRSLRYNDICDDCYDLAYHNSDGSIAPLPDVSHDGSAAS